MEKQYSVQFFSNFVENLQSLCHTYLEFSQSVEVSGYVCVEIDSVRKERYVLSEMIQSIGQSISESYCTKVFKSSPSGPVQRLNFCDITNSTNVASDVNLREGRMLPLHYSSQDQTEHGGLRPQIFSSTPASLRQSQIRTSSKHLPLTKTSPPHLRKTRTLCEHPSQNSTFTSSHSSSSENQTFQGDRSQPIQTYGSLAEKNTNDKDTNKARVSFTNNPEKSENRLGKRQYSKTSQLMSGSLDDENVVFIKEEPGSVQQDEDEDESKEQPPVKRREESLRLPDSLVAVHAEDPSSEDDFQNPISGYTYDLSLGTQAAPNLNSVRAESSRHLLDVNPDLNFSLDTSSMIHKIQPPPTVSSTPDGKRITCQLCRNSTPTEMSFVMHMNAHPSCKTCGIFVATHMDLRSHIQTQHGQVNMHKCKFCEKVFLTRSGVVEHQRLKHENTAPRFVCVVCGHVCVRKRHLEDHLENVHNKKNKTPS